MAYTPYQSDAPPPSPGEWETPKPKSWPWITALVLIVGGLAFAIYWVTRPKIVPPPNPPLAAIALADGTELRLVGTQAGGTLNISSNDDYDGRVRWENETRRGRFGQMGSSSSGHGGSGENSAWLVFSIYDPATKEFTRPRIKTISVIEADKRLDYEGNPTNESGNSLPPVQGVSFGVLPRRSQELELEFDHRGQTVTAKIANPFRPDPMPAPFVAKPLPQTVEMEGVKVEFKSATIGESTSTTNGKTTKKPYMQTSISVTEPGVEGAKFDIGRTFFDATGNSSWGFLPLDETVWGMRVSVTESTNYPYTPDRITSLGKMKFPAAGEAIPITLPAVFKSEGITEGFFFGAADLTWNGGTLSASVGGGPAKAVGKISQRWSSNQNLQNPSIVLFSNGKSGFHGMAGRLRVRWKNQVFGIQPQGSSMSNGDRVERFDWYPGNLPKGEKGPQPGDEIEIEFIVPKVRSAEFYFERPALQHGEVVGYARCPSASSP